MNTKVDDTQLIINRLQSKHLIVRDEEVIGINRFFLSEYKHVAYPSKENVLIWTNAKHEEKLGLSSSTRRSATDMIMGLRAALPSVSLT